MKHTKSMAAKCGLSLSVVGMLLLPAPPAHAQSTACVSLLVGAGYAAWMRVVSGSYATSWSDSFPIGQTRCKSLKNIADGQEFTVQVSAVLGSSQVHCTPSLAHVASSTATVTFQAWGTTLSVKCQMPSGDSLNAVDVSTTPSEDGLKAAEAVKSGGGNLKPPD